MGARGTVISVTDELVTETCCSCSILFAFPRWLKEQLLEKRAARKFYCPSGHEQWYVGEAEADKLRRERDLLKQQAARMNDEIAAQKRENAKLKKRVANGVCPCCARSFGNLQRHMKTKHPDYQETVQ